MYLVNFDVISKHLLALNTVITNAKFSKLSQIDHVHSFKTPVKVSKIDHVLVTYLSLNIVYYLYDNIYCRLSHLLSHCYLSLLTHYGFPSL